MQTDKKGAGTGCRSWRQRETGGLAVEEEGLASGKQLRTMGGTQLIITVIIVIV